MRVHPAGPRVGWEPVECSPRRKGMTGPTPALVRRERHLDPGGPGSCGQLRSCGLSLQLSQQDRSAVIILDVVEAVEALVAAADHLGLDSSPSSPRRGPDLTSQPAGCPSHDLRRGPRVIRWAHAGLREEVAG